MSHPNCPVCSNPPDTVHVYNPMHRARQHHWYVRCPKWHLYGGRQATALQAALSWDHAVRRFLALRRIVNLLRGEP